MPATDKQFRTQKLTAVVKNKELEPLGRIRAARRLLKHTSHSARASKASRALARELLKHETEAVRKAAADLLEFLTTQREIPEDLEGPDELPLATKIGAATNYVDPYDCGTPEEILAEMNKDVRSEPVPAKFIYYPSGQPQFLKEQYPDLFSGFSGDDITAFGEDPFNELLRISFARVLNPEFAKAYSYWKFRRFGHEMPGQSSTWYLRWCREEDVRRWTELGTLVIPSEQVVGYELRRREHISGFVQRHEIPFAFCFYLQILSGDTQNVFVGLDDVPLMYMTEFDFLKTDDERKLERAAVSQ